MQWQSLGTTFLSLVITVYLPISTLNASANDDCYLGYQFSPSNRDLAVLFNSSQAGSLKNRPATEINTAIKLYNKNYAPDGDNAILVNFHSSNRSPAPTPDSSIDANFAYLKDFANSGTLPISRVDAIYVPSIYIQQARRQTKVFTDFIEFFLANTKGNPSLQNKMVSIFKELSSQRQEYIDHALAIIGKQTEDNIPNMLRNPTELSTENRFLERLEIEVRQLTRAGMSAADLLKEDLRVSVLNQGLSYEEKVELDSIIDIFYIGKIENKDRIPVNTNRIDVSQQFFSHLRGLSHLPAILAAPR